MVAIRCALLKHRDFSLLLWIILIAGWIAWWILQTNDLADLPNDLYIWNRAWNGSVQQGVQEASAKVSTFMVLAAQIDWENNRIKTTKINCDYKTLKQTGKAVGVAIRVGRYPGPYEGEGNPIDTIVSVASTALSEASAAGLAIQEIQIDYDCPESKLAGYRVWVEALKRTLAPVPVTITSLPSWLKHPEFNSLVKGMESYVLQVHSLETPRGLGDPITLFDPDRAWEWVKSAGSMGTPFRLALPTYGYRVVFDSEGKFVGLSAEGRELASSADYQTREVHSDPRILSQFVTRLKKRRPKNLQGLIWFRMPTREDQLNWRWPTLAAVMEGRVPEPKLEVDLVWRDEKRLADLLLVNNGDGEAQGSHRVSVTWNTNELLAGDALSEFSMRQPGPGEVEFLPDEEHDPGLLRPGDRRPVGWLRFEKSAEVETHVVPIK